MELECDNPILFVRADNESMAFNMNPSGSARQKVKSLLESGGGILFDSPHMDFREHMIRLVAPNQVLLKSEVDTFDYKYVENCVMAGHILPNLIEYRTNKNSVYAEYDPLDVLLGVKKWSELAKKPTGIKVTDFDIDFDSDIERENENRYRNFKSQRKNYTRKEQLEILQHLIKLKAYKYVNGNSIWKRLEHRNCCNGRSWQSLKNHFLKTVYPQIQSFGLDEKTVKRFRLELTDSESEDEVLLKVDEELKIYSSEDSDSEENEQECQPPISSVNSVKRDAGNPKASLDKEHLNKKHEQDIRNKQLDKENISGEVKSSSCSDDDVNKAAQVDEDHEPREILRENVHRRNIRAMMDVGTEREIDELMQNSRINEELCDQFFQSEREATDNSGTKESKKKKRKKRRLLTMHKSYLSQADDSPIDLQCIPSPVQRVDETRVNTEDRMSDAEFASGLREAEGEGLEGSSQPVYEGGVTSTQNVLQDLSKADKGEALEVSNSSNPEELVLAIPDTKGTGGESAAEGNSAQISEEAIPPPIVAKEIERPTPRETLEPGNRVDQDHADSLADHSDHVANSSLDRSKSSSSDLPGIIQSDKPFTSLSEARVNSDPPAASNTQGIDICDTYVLSQPHVDFLPVVRADLQALEQVKKRTMEQNENTGNSGTVVMAAKGASEIPGKAQKLMDDWMTDSQENSTENAGPESQVKATGQNSDDDFLEGSDTETDQTIVRRVKNISRLKRFRKRERKSGSVHAVVVQRLPSDIDSSDIELVRSKDIQHGHVIPNVCSKNSRNNLHVSKDQNERLLATLIARSPEAACCKDVNTASGRPRRRSSTRPGPREEDSLESSSENPVAGGQSAGPSARRRSLDSNSSQSDIDDPDSPSPPPVKKSKLTIISLANLRSVAKPKRTFRPYERREDEEILKYFTEHGGYTHRKGNSVWMKMEQENAVPGRSWQSLKSRFKVMVEKIRLENYGTSEHSLLEADMRGKNGEESSDAEGDTTRRTSSKYTFKEDKKILEYICSNKRYEQTGGVSIWKAMEEKNIVNDRSWSSLKERFRKVIMKNIENYGLTNDQLLRFKNLSKKSPKKKLQRRHKN